MSKLFRTIKSDYPRIKWDTKNTNIQNYHKCHWGQRKLFYSEIEFLTIVAKHYELSKCVIVYTGSANGIHINILCEMFPMIHWILYDPNKFLIDAKHYDKIEIHTGDDGFFTDDKVSDVLKNPLVKGKHILFISDIRLTTEDDAVVRDMVIQQRWLINMGAVYYMLKYRLPFHYNKTFDYDISDIKDKIMIKNSVNQEIDKVGKVLYLAGTVFTQIYPPQFSTETRLIGHSKNGIYLMKYYDSQTHEETLLHFNVKDRNKDFTYGKSGGMKNHLAQFNDGYENVTEYYLIKRYLKTMKRKFSFKDIIRYLYFIHNSLVKYTHRDFYDCSILSLKKVFEKTKKRHPDQINQIVKNAIESYNQQITYLEKQKNWLNGSKNSGVLKPTDYANQINHIDKIILYIKDFIKSLDKMN